MSTFNSIITSSPYTIYQAGFLATLISGDITYAVFSALAIVMGNGMTHLEKLISKEFLNSRVGKRPSGCGTIKGDKDAISNCIGCGIFSQPGKKSETWGMPSGHAQITAFAATFWTIYISLRVKNEKDSEEKKKQRRRAIITIPIIWGLAAVVWIQRVVVKCNTPAQCTVGVIIGGVLGLISYAIVSKILANMPQF